jgi:hypothetical protein
LPVALPGHDIIVDLAAPLVDGTAADVALRVDGAPIATAVTAYRGGIKFHPTTLIPLGASVDVSLEGARDPMGRAFTDPRPLTPLATTATLTDLTLATPPPAGAVVGVGLPTTFVAGMGLCAVDDLPGLSRTYPFAFVVALGDVSGTTVDVAFIAPRYQSGQTEIAVARADGTHGAAVMLSSSAITNPLTLPIPPGTGPISLIVASPNQVYPPLFDSNTSPIVCLQGITVR